MKIEEMDITGTGLEVTLNKITKSLDMTGTQPIKKTIKWEGALHPLPK